MTAAPYLAREILGAKAIVDHLRERGFDDEDLILDSIEGETEAMEGVSRLLRWMAEKQAAAAAIKALEADYAARRKRYEDAVKTARGALASFMDQCGLKKIERPEATLSLSARGPQVIYPADLNPETLPEAFRKWTCEADRAAIKDAMLAGEEIDGLSLSNGETTLTVRIR
ncbi:MAG: siphovirus Gp157 family protein [Pseudomonadota bacterium]